MKGRTRQRADSVTAPDCVQKGGGSHTRLHVGGGRMQQEGEKRLKQPFLGF